MQECKGCGKLAQKLLRCARCSISTYCDKDCQKLDWQSHRKYFCRTEGRNLPKHPAPKVTPKLPLGMRRQKAIQIYESKDADKASPGELGLFCYGCGQQEGLSKLSGSVLCGECLGNTLKD